jgi:hypothetical protein
LLDLLLRLLRLLRLLCAGIRHRGSRSPQPDTQPDLQQGSRQQPPALIQHGGQQQQQQPARQQQKQPAPLVRAKGCGAGSRQKPGWIMDRKAHRDHAANLPIRRRARTSTKQRVIVCRMALAK